MAIRTQEEILNEVREFIGESSDESALNFLEDVTDTLADLHTRASNDINWEQRYNDLDATWRQRYRDRFFQPTDSDDDDKLPEEFETPSVLPKQLKFEDLFKES